GQRAARADGAREAVDRAVRLLPDLWARTCRVAVAIRVVVPLVRVQDAVRLRGLELLGRALGGVHVVIRVLERHRGHFADFRAGEAQRILFLLRLRVRHQDQRAIAARFADQREADARVAGRAFDDEPAGLDDAALFGVENHVLRGAVFYRPAGVQELALP